jgi:zinc D-Ala-D-Ala carboxypeptidase
MPTEHSHSRRTRHFFALIIILVIAAAVGLGWRTIGNTPESSSEQPKDAGLLTDPNSVRVIVNKKRPLQPADYTPKDLVVPAVPLRLEATSEEMMLRTEAARALETMIKDAKGQGVSLMLASAYRSYAFQKKLYSYYVDQQGQTEADTQSARPGHSEHQTGLAADLEPTSQECEIQACFAKTTEGTWLAAHAYEYGFVIRYTDGQEATTGYVYEPWHVRYLGKDLARQIHDSPAKTLEDFFNLEKASKY